MTTLLLDRIDLAILEHLQQDGRLANVDLAARVGLSPTPCLRRVRRLKEARLISSYRAVVDRKQAGLGITVFVNIKIDGHRAGNAAEAQQIFRDMPEVLSCHVVSGEADFLLEVVVPDLEAYEQLVFHRLLALPMVKDVHSNFVIRTVKDRAPLPLGHLARR